MEQYPNISGQQRIASRQPTWRKDRDKRTMDIAHAFITKVCLDQGKILHEDVLFKMFMDRPGDGRGLWPAVFSKLYHSMIPNLIKAVNTAKENNNGPRTQGNNSQA